MTSLHGKQTLVSRTAFEGLAVDEGEESDAEEVSFEPTEQQPSVVTAEKPSKTALKKAAKAARLEKKQQKAAAKGRTTSPSRSSSATDEHSSSVGTFDNPVEVLSTTEAESPVVEAQPLPPAAAKGTENGNNGQRRTIQEESETLVPPIAPKPIQTLAPPPPNPPPAPIKESVVLPTESATLSMESEQKKKRQNMLTRTLWTFIMIGGFLSLLLMGHLYMVLLVMICQTAVYREVTALFSIKYIEGEDTSMAKDPWSKTLNWYFFAVTNYYLYGESIIYYFKHVVFADAQLMPFATNHRIISFTLYTIGFVGFVLSLKKGYLRRQFGLFGWVHMSLMLIVVSSHFIVNNILEGLIWLWVPASLVICNDVFAYIWGITIGRTPLIKLSPKKTVEGFVGAFFSTMIFGIIWGSVFMQWDYMICPVRDLGVSVWSSHSCTPNPVFVWKEWEMWAPLRVFLSSLLGRSVTMIPYASYHLHILVMATFASLVAPFGGFFASGFKRAFNIKDFGDSIPGHGGMTDRMDCQFLMGVFTYVYYSSIIRENRVTVGSVLQTVVSGLTVEEQLELIADLRRYLTGQGIKVPL